MLTSATLPFPWRHRRHLPRRQPSHDVLLTVCSRRGEAVRRSKAPCLPEVPAGLASGMAGDNEGSTVIGDAHGGPRRRRRRRLRLTHLYRPRLAAPTPPLLRCGAAAAATAVRIAAAAAAATLFCRLVHPRRRRSSQRRKRRRRRRRRRRRGGQRILFLPRHRHHQHQAS